MKKYILLLMAFTCLGAEAKPKPKHNTLTKKEIKQGWELLFDGVSTEHWRGVNRDCFPLNGWYVENGELFILERDKGQSTMAGDIVTVCEYDAFEFSIDFKVSEAANSGIKYFVVEKRKVANNRRSNGIGLEYQILDDEKHPDAELYTSFPGSRANAGLYDIIAPKNVKFNGVDQWNTAVIKVGRDNHVEHWLNCVKVLEYERCSDELRERITGSKYKQPFGEEEKGHILLQDHGDLVYFRNIKIRKL